MSRWLTPQELQAFRAKQWEDLKREFWDKCAYCGSEGPLTKDHIVPKSKRGFNNISNIMPACQPCNSRRGAMHIMEWLKQTNASAQTYKRAKQAIKGRKL